MTSKEMLAEMKVAAEVEVQKIVDLTAAIDAELKVEKDLSFDEGVKQAGTVNAEDKLYSEAEMQAEVKASVDPLNEKVAALEAKIAALEAAPAPAPSEDAIAAAVAAKQAEMVKDFESAKVDDDAFLAKYKAPAAPTV